MSLSERITAAKLMLAQKHKESKEMCDAACREVARNLRELHAAMGAQRDFDRVTVKRVSDLARVLMGSGYLNENRLNTSIKEIQALIKQQHINYADVPYLDLQSDTLSVTRVGEFRGFEYPQHFVRFFKSLTGKTPSAWRLA